MIHRDLLITAALFHDMGKIQEISDFPMNDYTDDGQLLGHIYIGARCMENAAAQIPNFPPKLKNELVHCILAASWQDGIWFAESTGDYGGNGVTYGG